MTNKIIFNDVQAAYEQALLLVDKDIIRIVAAVVLANQMPGNPVWLMLVAASSGGKSAVMMTLDQMEIEDGKPMVTFISDLTENTFASGFKVATGSASLLENMPIGGIFAFKDFTTLLSKRTESQSVIMSQLREIFDQKFDKRTGNQNDTEWRGKVGAIAGVTEAIHEYMSSMSVMGDRFIMYAQKMPPRRDVLRFIMKMREEGSSQNDLLGRAKMYMQRYIKDCMPYASKPRLYMNAGDKEHLMEVADFVTMARSGVFEDNRTGAVRFVPSPEMPTRLIDQLLMIGTAFCVMRIHDGNDPELAKEDMLALYKIAFDSIPLKRLWALKQLARHAYGVTVAGIASKLGYQTQIVQQWLDQLNALGICSRSKSTRGAGDLYVLNPDYVNIMVTYQNVEVVQDSLEGADDTF